MANDNKSKKGSSFFRSFSFVLFLLLAALFTAIGSLGVFKKLEYRMYDFLLARRKEPLQSPNILFVNVDNESIQSVGEWPWTRNVLADALIRMKELGAYSAIFDIEYLSPSPQGIAPNAEQNMNAAVSMSREEITQLIQEFSQSVEGGFISRRELPDVTKAMIADYIEPTLENMKEAISSSMYRDNDDYFARAIQFFENTWLTINTRDLGIQLSDDARLYAQKRLLIKKVTDINNYILKDNQYTSDEQYNGLEAGFSPALHELLTHAQGAGFTTVVIDDDGIRRRIELLYNYDGSYLGQLSFAPLLNLIDAQRIERKKYSLAVYGALFPGETKRVDFSIPLDAHGRMLINWLHSEHGSSFRNESVMFLYELDNFERNIATYLENIRANLLLDHRGAPLEYVATASRLIDAYEHIERQKQALLAKCGGYDIDGNLISGITEEEYSDYFALRASYFEDVQSFIEADHMSAIGSRLEQLLEQGLSSDDASNFATVMQEQFDALGGDYELYTQYFDEMKTVYDGAYCIIGNTASSSTDLGTNPFERSYPNVGTHANVMNTILQRDFITPVSWVIGMAFAVLLMFITMMLIYGRSDSVQNVVQGLVLFVIIGTLVALMIVPGLYIPLVTPGLFAVSMYVAGIIMRFMSSDKEKRFLRRAFSTYLSNEVVNEIVSDPQKLTLGGEDKHITALFTDIKGFSSFSELVTPSQLVSILNIYLSALSNIILEHDGTIDKYIGDAIVSFFGAPIDLPDHAYRACVAAVRMKQAEKEFNERHLADKAIPRALETRIGINTGNMVVGNMGTDMKMNYTIMGNDVNLASRLEGVNKIYKSWILVSEQTWNEADSGEHRGELVSRRLDRVRVVGINKPVQLYNVLGFKSEMTADELAAVDEFHEALDLYLQLEFKKAGRKFMKVHRMGGNDGAALVFAERCKEYLQNGVPKGWDGVMNMTTK